MSDTQNVSSHNGGHAGDALYAAAVDMALDAVVAADSQRRVVLFNPAAERMFGCTVADASGELIDRYLPNLLERSAPGDEPIAATAGAMGGEPLLAFRADGEEFSVTARTTRSDIDGQPFLTAVLREISSEEAQDYGLRQSEAMYREMFENLPVGIYQTTIDGKLLTANAEVVTLLAFDSLDDLLSIENTGDLYANPGEREKLVEENLVQTGDRFEAEYDMRRQDGGIVTVLNNFRVVKDEDGETLFYEGILLDISRRKLAEEELQRTKAELEERVEQRTAELQSSRQMLQTVIDNIPSSIFWKDSHAVYLGCNQHYASLAGLSSPEEIAGKTDADLHWSPAEAEALREADRRVMDSGAAELDTVEPHQHDDGQPFWLQVSRIPLRDADGNVTSILGTRQDITEHVRADDALRASEERFRLVFENTFEALIVHDKGIILDVTTTRDAVLQYPPNELLGTNLLDHVYESHRAEVTRYMRSGGGLAIETRALRKDGTVMDLELIGQAYRYQGRDVRLAAIRDITQRKLAEAAEREQRGLAEALSATASALNSSLKLEEVYTLVLNNLGRIIPGYEAANIMILDENEQVTVVDSIGYADYTDRLNALSVALLDMPPLQEALRARSAFAIPNVDDYPNWQRFEGAFPSRSFLTAPLRVRDEIVGFINLDSRTANAFNMAEAGRLEIFADQASIAIENARLHAETTQKEQRFRVVFEESPIGMVITGADGKRVDANNAILQTFGYEKSEFMQLSSSDMAFPEDEEKSEALFGELVTGQRDRFNLEKRYRHKEGHAIWGSATQSAIRDTSGNIIYTITLIEDISQRKKAAEERERLVTELLRLTAIVDNTTDFIELSTLDGEILYLNRAGLEMVQRTEGENAGQRVGDYHPLDSRTLLLEEAMPAALEDGVWTGEVELLRANGETLPVSAVLVSILDHTGAPQAIGAIMRDISERKQYEARLENTAEELRLATAMAREANRLKSEFLATMSHELRTPLNAIVGFTEILLAGMVGNLSEKQHHKISRIHLNSRRLLELINDLLNLAKIEAGRIDILHEPFSPSELVGRIHAEMESLAEQKGLAFEVDIDPALPATLMGDAPRIEQAVSNLLSNAFKFTSKGKVSMRANMRPHNDAWTIVIEDTGIGIPPHAIEFIFEEFRQVDSGTQRAYGGTGLGLAITRNLARLMGGDIGVASKQGEGSTFTLMLPMLEPQD